jgi:hypothetical protein
MRTGRALLAFGAAALTAGSLAACGSSGGPDVVAAPAGLGVSVLQYRSDQSLRRIQIKVTNDGPAPLTVVGARLSSPLLAGAATWTSRGGTDDARIGPGEATDLPAALPASSCPGPAGDRPSTAQVVLRRPDGSPAVVEGLAVRDQYAAVAGVHGQDCRRVAALAVADLELVEPLVTKTEEGSLIGYLGIRVTPTGRPGALTLESVGSTTLLDPPDQVAWTLGRRFTAASPPATLTLRLLPARCDPHAIAEDKLGTVMPVTLRVDGQPPGIVTLVAGTKLKNEIQNFVLAACGH